MKRNVKRGKASSSQALVLSDSKPFRWKVWRQYQGSLRAYEKAVALLRQFKDVDTESYRLWYEREFTDVVGKLRHLQSTVVEMAAWIDQVQTYAQALEIPSEVSFEILTKARVEGRLAELWQKLSEKRKAPQRRLKNKEVMDEETWAHFEADFEQLFEEAVESHDASQKTVDPAAGKTLKSLYHQLALRLHPDTNPEQGEEERQLFHLTQRAYRENDLEALEEIWKRVDGGGVGVFSWETAPISEIMNRKRAVDRRIQDVSVELKYARDHMAWDFTAVFKDRKRLANLQAKIRDILDGQRMRMDKDWSDLNAILERWDKNSRRKRR